MLGDIYERKTLVHKRCKHCKSKLHHSREPGAVDEFEKCYCQEPMDLHYGGYIIHLEFWSQTIHRTEMMKVIVRNNQGGEVYTTTVRNVNLFKKMCEVKSMIHKGKFPDPKTGK